MEGDKMYEGNKETYVKTQCNTKARLDIKNPLF